MIRRTAALSLVLAIAGALTFAEPRAQQSVFRTSTDTVPVSVSVTQGRAPVVGLGTGDFELTDNGVPQEIEAVLTEAQPIDVTVVMGAVPISEIDDLRRGVDASQRMYAMLRPDDRIRYVDAGGDIQATSMRAVGTPAVRGDLGPTAGLSLQDGLFVALAWPADPARRHLVVVFTNGDDTWSTLEPARLPVIAGRSDAVLHAVLYNALPQSKSAMSSDHVADWRASYRALDASVQKTGGLLHVIADRAAGFQRVLADVRSSYLLRYTPRGVNAPGWHKIAVKVTRSGSYTVRARQGYER